MEAQDRSTIEKSKDGYQPEMLLSVQQRAWEALAAIKSRIVPGMREEDAYHMANQVLDELGAERKWHRCYVRFGVNTILKYGLPSQPNVILGENDIYFLDLGPVWNGYEGDVGDTIATGNDPDMIRCAQDARRIFAIVRDHWKKERPTGEALYAFARQTAESMGWQLVPSTGHRLSDFPHAIYFRGHMGDVDFTPAPEKWVLEIHLRHPERSFGAFYEDLLQ